jgi:hypothetical protein
MKSPTALRYAHSVFGNFVIVLVVERKIFLNLVLKKVTHTHTLVRNILYSYQKGLLYNILLVSKARLTIQKFKKRIMLFSMQQDTNKTNKTQG